MTSFHPSEHRAVILAAGQARRLGPQPVPKPLLTFEGRTLLERHLEILNACGVQDVAVVVGYGAEAVRLEMEVLAPLHLTIIENPAFREGNVVSLWQARLVLQSGVPIILMDADVLYDRRLMQRLLRSSHGNCFLLDRQIEPGDEPVKLCISRGWIVDFGKRPAGAYEWHGESVGFFRFTSDAATELARQAAEYVAKGLRDQEYEAPIRDMVLAHAGNRFGFEYITGLPWIEIDFPEDVARARDVILPELVS